MTLTVNLVNVIFVWLVSRMGKLYFKYGVMNSSKTANLLMVAYNYESQGRRIFCLKPSTDTRWSDDPHNIYGSIKSRAVPNSHSCKLISRDRNLFDMIEDETKWPVKLSAVLIDEAQFLTREQVKQLADVAEKLNINVLCFGLKNTFVDGELFEGSAALLYYASDIQEIKTICKYCNRKATMNLRLINGKPVYSGDTIAIGDVKDEDSEMYAQVCYKHYKNPPLDKEA